MPAGLDCLDSNSDDKVTAWILFENKLLIIVFKRSVDLKL